MFVLFFRRGFLKKPAGHGQRLFVKASQSKQTEAVKPRTLYLLGWTKQISFQGEGGRVLARNRVLPESA
jgi:hypothetical protein